METRRLFRPQRERSIARIRQKNRRHQPRRMRQPLLLIGMHIRKNCVHEFASPLEAEPIECVRRAGHFRRAIDAVRFVQEPCLPGKLPSAMPPHSESEYSRIFVSLAEHEQNPASNHRSDTGGRQSIEPSGGAAKLMRRYDGAPDHHFRRSLR